MNLLEKTRLSKWIVHAVRPLLLTLSLQCACWAHLPAMIMFGLRCDFMNLPFGVQRLRLPPTESFVVRRNAEPTTFRSQCFFSIFGWVLSQLCQSSNTYESTLETSDSTDWVMAHPNELSGFIEDEKTEIHWHLFQWGRPWHEMEVPERKFCVMTPLGAPWRALIQLIGGRHIWLILFGAWKVKKQKSIAIPSSEADHDVTCESSFCIMFPLDS